LVYEYVGNVVNPASFKKRMREYAAEGIQHFYFMMLQKTRFATPLLFFLLTTICAVHRCDTGWRDDYAPAWMTDILEDCDGP